MPKDVIITPGSGLIDFKDTLGVSDATIQLDDLGNLIIANPGGNLNIGNTAASVYIGDGVNSVDIIFEQSGAIRALSTKTLTVGAANSSVTLTGTITVSANPTVTGNILPSANATYTLGNTTNRWSNIWGLASSAQYADLAEKYLADEPYAAGTLVIFGGNAEITVTHIDHDTRVAGVISTEPAYLMNDSADKGNLWLPVALTGRVPCQVQGPVTKGDLIVSSTIPGVGKKIDKELYEPGCIIGKSLEDHTESTIKTIEVVVGRF